MAKIASILNQTIKKLQTKKTDGFWPGFLVGIAYFAFIFSWIWSLYPLESVGIQNKFVALLLILIGFTGSVLVMALPWGGFSLLLSNFVARRPKVYFIPLFAAGTFALAEYIRAWLYGILWWGTGSVLGPHWTFGNIAYWLSDFPFLAHTASLWGIYGIEFALALFVTALIIMLRKKRVSSMLLLQMILVLGLATASGTYLARSDESVTRKPIPIALVQTHKETKVSWSPSELLADFQQKLELVKKAAGTISENGNGGMIILPEGAELSKTLGKFADPGAVTSYFQRLSSKDILVIDNAKAPHEYGATSQTIMISSRDGLVGTYQKRVLSPWGEFLPFLIRGPALFIGTLSQKELLNLDRDLIPGTDSNVITGPGNISIAVIICSDILSPWMGDNGPADLLIATNSIALFRGNRLLERQLLDAAKMRAIENNRYTLMASNFGRSYIINNVGTVEKSTSDDGYEMLTGWVVPQPGSTWYNKLGDWPILLLSLGILFFGIKKKFPWIEESSSYSRL